MGGSPAYRYHGNLGLLSQSSLEYSPVPLTTHENGHSDHIVHTSGGGRCGSMKKSRRKGRGKSKRAGSIVGAMVIRNKIKRSTSSRSRRRSTGSRPRRRRSYVRGVQKSPKRKTSYLASVFGF